MTSHGLTQTRQARRRNTGIDDHAALCPVRGARSEARTPARRETTTLLGSWSWGRDERGHGAWSHRDVATATALAPPSVSALPRSMRYRTSVGDSRTPPVSHVRGVGRTTEAALLKCQFGLVSWQLAAGSRELVVRGSWQLAAGGPGPGVSDRRLAADSWRWLAVGGLARREPWHTTRPHTSSYPI